MIIHTNTHSEVYMHLTSYTITCKSRKSILLKTNHDTAVTFEVYYIKKHILVV